MTPGGSARWGGAPGGSTVGEAGSRMILSFLIREPRPQPEGGGRRRSLTPPIAAGETRPGEAGAKDMPLDGHHVPSTTRMARPAPRPSPRGRPPPLARPA